MHRLHRDLTYLPAYMSFFHVFFCCCFFFFVSFSLLLSAWRMVILKGLPSLNGETPTRRTNFGDPGWRIHISRYAGPSEYLKSLSSSDGMASGMLKLIYIY